MNLKTRKVRSLCEWAAEDETVMEYGYVLETCGGSAHDPWHYLLLIQELLRMTIDDLRHGRPCLAVVVIDPRTNLPGKKFFEWVRLGDRRLTFGHRRFAKSEQSKCFAYYGHPRVRRAA